MFGFLKKNKENATEDRVLKGESEGYTSVAFNVEKIPKEKREEGLYLYGWIVNDGDLIEKGMPLYLISKGKKSTLTTIFDPVLSIEAGVVELLVKEDEELKDGQNLYQLHGKGNYSNENLPENSSFKFYFNKYKFPEFSYSIKRLKEWHKQDGDLVSKGDLLVSFCTPYLDKSEFVNHYAEKSGFLNIALSHENLIPSLGYKQSELVYEIKNSDENRVENKFNNIPEISVDDFTKTKTIRWKIVSSIECLRFSKGIISLSQDKKTKLLFSFINIDNKDFIAFQFDKNELRLNKDDIISFLFQDEKMIHFKLNGSSYDLDCLGKDSLQENKCQISFEELNEFANNKLAKWKISSPKRNLEIIGGYYGAEMYLSEDNFYKVINKFTNEYMDLVKKEIEGYQPLTRNNIPGNYEASETKEECFVYLMIDITNNHHKIGISNKPEWREKTLQSEKPTIELIASKKFVSRKIASSIEKALHSTYSEKRIRGEWFLLDKSDVNDIIKTLE